MKLYQKDLNKYKQYFKDSAHILGIDIKYQYLMSKCNEVASGEISYSKLSKPIDLSVIIESGTPKVDSLKSLGWFTNIEDTKDNLLVDFPIDTPNLQIGCRFYFQSNENQKQIKIYEIIKLTTEPLYTTCIKALCIPVLENNSTTLDNKISYGKQNIISDTENYTFINDEADINIF